jgi:hypothetical protein
MDYVLTPSGLPYTGSAAAAAPQLGLTLLLIGAAAALMRFARV